MSEKNAAGGNSGTGWVWAGVGFAIAVAAGSYLWVQQRASPTEDELAALVPETDEVASTELPAQNDTIASPVEDDGDIAIAVDENDQAEASNDAAGGENTATQPREQADAVVENAETSDAENANDLADVPPSIDEVRLAADGVAVIAGKAVPGATVEVLVDGEVVTSAQADSGGSFAAVGIVEGDAEPRVLSLRSQSGESTVDSVDEVIVAPVVESVSESATKEVAEIENVTKEATVDASSSAVEDDSAPQVSEVTESLNQPAVAVEAGTLAQSDTEAVSPAPEATKNEMVEERQLSSDSMESAETAPTIDTNAPEAPKAEETGQSSSAPQIALLKSDEQGVTLLQTSPEPPARVQLDTIGYSDDGTVQLSGRANREAPEVRVYLNNRLAATLPVAGAGQWRGEIPGVEVGVYTLRLDAVDAQGVVTSRLETPFKREAPEVLAAASANAEGPITAITVQRGDTLWAIARDRYGEGLSYVQVYNANRDAIRDPDLIYPGQIFTLPQE